MNRLIQLSSGQWVNPNAVQSIDMLPAINKLTAARVWVVGVFIANATDIFIECGTLMEAETARDEIAAKVNAEDRAP